MSVEVERPGPVRRGIGFYHEIVAEMRKVTWPDKTQVRQMSVGVILLSLFIGLVIFALDRVLQLLLVAVPTKLFTP